MKRRDGESANGRFSFARAARFGVRPSATGRIRRGELDAAFLPKQRDPITRTTDPAPSVDWRIDNRYDSSVSMSTKTAQLLEEFSKLPPDEQREFSEAILRQTAQFEYDAPSDEELTAAAGEIFRMLDREEDANARSR